MNSLTNAAAAVLILGAALSQRPAAALAMQGATGQIPCNPVGPPPNTIRVTPGGVVVVDPTVELIEDQVVTEPLDIGTELPQLLGGTDGALAGGGCDISFDAEPGLPNMVPPNAIAPPMPLINVPLGPPPRLPVVHFVPPVECLGGATGPIREKCGLPLDCRLPFCGRDITSSMASGSKPSPIT